MVQFQDILDFAARLAKEFDPEKIILFGSFAEGEPTEDSDVDLLVIKPYEGRWVDQAVMMKLQIGHSFPLDLLVRSPEEVRHRLSLGDPFIRDIMNNGKVLYERANRILIPLQLSPLFRLRQRLEKD